MDPVEKLFKALPSPSPRPTAPSQDSRWEEPGVIEAFNSFSPSESRDPDIHFITPWVKAFLQDQSASSLCANLGWFALHKPEIPDDGSEKSRHMKYYAWVAQGRKEETFPFENEETSEAQRGNLPERSHAFLPPRLTALKVCDNCAVPGAKFVCSACLLQIDSHHVISTTYCSKECQVRQRKKHRPQCLERRELYRAVSLLYDIFIMFQNETWVENSLTSISEEHGIIKAVYCPREEWPTQGKRPFALFPYNMAPSEEHGLSVLLNNKCRELQSTFYGLVDLLLRPLCKVLKEIEIIPRNAHRPTCVTSNGSINLNMHCIHNVLWLVLQSGEEMVVDLTGAQFGWRETVAKWEPWLYHRTAGKAVSNRFGTIKQNKLDTYPSSTTQFLGYSDNQHVSLAQKIEAAIWDNMDTMGNRKDKIPTAPTLYKLDNTGFAIYKQSIISVAHTALRDGLSELHKSSVGRCYLDADGNWRSTENHLQSQLLTQVWLTDEDVRRAREQGKSLRAIYELRCKDKARRRRFKALGLNMP
ncbi:hypothetical protein F4825DRAFT_464968 [Nemania diffusa]|nr:hypothetical protein F4825DRAFT_464968 [Nemania diffusa]